MKRLYSLLLISQITLITVAQGTWQQRAPFGGAARHWATAFTLNNKAYVGTGTYTGVIGLSDFWEYDPTSNQWTQKAGMPMIRSRAVSASAGGKGYVGTGTSGGVVNDWHAYDPVTNTWQQKASFPGSPREDAFSFSIDGMIYVGGGVGSGTVHLDDVHVYDPGLDQWSVRASLPPTAPKRTAAYVVAGKAYIVSGVLASGGSLTNSTWQYDPILDTWTEMAAFPGTARFYPNGFTLDEKIYVGTGNASGELFNDWYQYDPQLDQWIVVAGLPFTARTGTTAFAIDGKGYLCTGRTDVSSFTNELWEFTPLSTIVPLVTSSSSFKIFPNPSSGEVFVDLGNYSGPALLVIHDATGRMVQQERVMGSRQSLALDHLGTGIFAVKVITPDGEHLSRLIFE